MCRENDTKIFELKHDLKLRPIDRPFIVPEGTS